MPMAHLNALPDELMLSILHHASFSTLRSLCLTNRRLHRLTLEPLYSTFVFHGGGSERFLRTISGNPSLAKHVRTIDWDSDTEKPVFSLHGRLPDDDRSLIKRNIESLGTAYARELARHGSFQPFSRLGSIAYLEAMMVFTPHISRLDVAETYQWDDDIYWFNPIRLQCPHPFSHLKEAYIHGPLRIENISALLFLPSMRTLDLFQAVDMVKVDGQTFEWEVRGPDDLSASPPFPHHQSSSIEHFHLRQSWLETRVVTALIGAFRALRSFTYEHALHGELSASWHVGVEHAELVDALGAHAATLARLRLNYRANCNAAEAVRRELWYLDRFPAVRTLHVHHSAVKWLWVHGSELDGGRLGLDPEDAVVRHLPPGLECLGLMYDGIGDSDTECEHPLCLGFLKRAPGLRRVVADMDLRLYIGCDEECDWWRVERELKEVGIEWVFGEVGAWCPERVDGEAGTSP